MLRAFLRPDEAIFPMKTTEKISHVQPRFPLTMGYPRFKYSSNDHLKVLHKITFGFDDVVEVVGDPDNGSYEWLIRTSAGITHYSDCGYGCSANALLDGLIVAL